MRRYLIAVFATIFTSGTLDSPISANALTMTPRSDYSEKALELSKHYLDDVHFSDTLRSLLLNIRSQFVSDMKIKDKNKLNALDMAISSELDNEIPEVKDSIAKIYASTFTEKELSAAISFYESPEGKAFSTRMPSMLPAISEITAVWQNKFAHSVWDRYCLEVHDCK